MPWVQLLLPFTAKSCASNSLLDSALFFFLALLSSFSRSTVTVDIASLLKASDSEESAAPPPPLTQQQQQQQPLLFTRPASIPPGLPQVITTATAAPAHGLPLYVPSQVTHQPPPPLPQGPPVVGGGGGGSKRGASTHPTESPAKKQSKWSPDEDALIIELRGSGMKWEDISKRLPGRSAISCRLHYQNYLERRSEWDEEKKTKLARLYERLKPEMWAKLAEEMAVPWRAAEAMHWQLGEADIARRNGVTPFSLAAVNVEQPQQSQPPLAARNSPSRQQHHHHHHHAHSHSQGSIAPPPQARFPRAGGYSPLTGSRRRESLPPPPPPQVMQQMHQLHEPGPGLAPIQSRVGAGGGIGGGGALPGLAELTTGVSPYSTPAYVLGGLGPPGRSPGASPLGTGLHYSMGEGLPGIKRRASPGGELQRESSRRRR
ncbi:hypothetical protein D7B24_001726 [Verticillium nonalfalfae]|uniref:MYB DNA-binding domain-containing protein n=1 Tax=Verticillium nonalfalfae TaxID=1051616 RepID=A0A3M9XZU1_9PEZI|nr:uncharacterized protein D7B24_001726 [Verticillium nonalfalfae]RNJ53521.1 hypothetical protein D7B24_001726 [Verticillium nonalfalfae]